MNFTITAKHSLFKKALLATFLFALSFFSFAEEKNSQNAGEQKAKKELSPLEQFKKYENDIRYYFFFDFLTRAICTPKVFEELKPQLTNAKFQNLWSQYIEETQTISLYADTNKFKAAELAEIKNSWLLGFPTPNKEPFPYFAIIVSGENNKARYFTLEKTFNYDGSELKKPAMICEWFLGDNDKCDHQNIGVSLEGTDAKAFTEAVKAVLEFSR